MAGKKAAIEVIDETEVKRRKKVTGNVCPMCGTPGGKTNCNNCGWGIEDIGPDYSVSSGDPVTTLQKARHEYGSIKLEIKEMKEQNEALIANNRRFTELVEAMEKEINKLRSEAGNYVYSFNAGGWGKIGDIDKTKLLMKKKTVTVDDINKQLEEIMKLTKRYKK